MPSLLRLLATFVALASGTALAQLTPPAQSHVANLGAAPLRASLSQPFYSGRQFTFEGWIYLTGHTPFAWLMGRGLAVSGADPFVAAALQLSDDGTKLSFTYSTFAAGSYRSITSPDALPLRTWTHVAGVMDGTSSRLFVNGQLVASGSALTTRIIPGGDVPFGVGIAYLANGNTNYPAFPGYARQLRVWTTARTAAQLSADATVATPANRDGLYAAWPLDEASGTTARDTSGNDQPLTGAIVALRTTLLDAGPFFNVTTTTPPGNVLADADDGILIDFDSDGDPDLLTFHITVPPTIPETRRRIRAFRNTNGTFADATDAVLGDVTMVHPRDRHVADFNGDGRVDILIVGHGTDTPPFPGEQAKLLIQSADGRLLDESAARLPQRSGFTHNLAVGDIDGDGDLDAYLANIFGGDTGPRFLINNGAGAFTEATDRLPADIANRALGSVHASAALIDVNGDARPDLLLGGESASPRNELLLNDGAGRFTRQSAFTLPPKLFGPAAVTVAIVGADLNADGAQDIILSTTGGSIALADGRTIDGYGLPGLQLLLNAGNGTFYDATARLNLAFDSVTDTWIEWIRVADLNADGRPDLVLQGAPNATGRAFSRTILLNRGAATFTDASAAYLGGSVTYLQTGDVDRDGRIDLVGLNANAIVVARATKPLAPEPFLDTPDQPGRLANLSVRTQAGTGDETLIAGFALGGGSGTKQLLVRAVGPTLGAFGLDGFLPDPVLVVAPLNQPSLAENDNWGGGAQFTAINGLVGAFPLQTDHDAALILSPAPGAYTATVTGSPRLGGPTTGVALVELYDAGATNTPRLTNVSARTRVGTGADVLIVGFVVNGNVPKKLLIRAIGPTLGAFGVGGTLADPVLDIRPLGTETIIATNDDWRGTAALKSTFARVGAFALSADDSRDGALAIELPPGAYTATVSGKNNTTGVALVEVYELP